MRELHQADPHPPLTSSQFRLQRLHPGAARHDLCQPGQGSAGQKTDAPVKCAGVSLQYFLSVRGEEGEAGGERHQGRHREDRQQGGHRPGPALPGPRHRRHGGGHGGPGETLPAGRGLQQLQRDHQDRGLGCHQDDLRLLQRHRQPDQQLQRAVLLQLRDPYF